MAPFFPALSYIVAIKQRLQVSRFYQIVQFLGSEKK